MVKAELSYNPYLQETKIRFNGRSPRVNSLVEKYQKEKLQDWLHKLPDIFRDEMNGYNFDLEFSGTKTDFEELKAAFKTAGIGDEQVHIFHKNELSERSDKMYEIEDLMNWLESHPNRRYDYSAVLEENKDLFEGEYEYLVLHGRQEDMNAFEEMNISVEIIEDVKTLEKTNLRNTPLLYVIDDDSSEYLISDVFYLRKREDVAQKQLFFRISPLLREDMVIRELKDLGVEAPQIVEKADDEAILRYFEVYPGSDSVREAIRLFNRDINRIREELKAEKEQKERANHSIYTKLDRLEEQAEAQKEALSCFNNPDKKDFEASYTVEKAQLIYRVSDWKNNKTKTTKVDEAMTLATEYSNFLCDAYDDYVRSLWNELQNDVQALRDVCYKWYAIGKSDLDFDAESVPSPDLRFDTVRPIINDLLSMHKIIYVAQNDIIGRIFKQNNSNQGELTPVETYFFQEWRAYAVSVVEPLANAKAEECSRLLFDFFDKLIALYKEHLKQLIMQTEADKDELASQLSEEDKILQDDIEWLTKFSDAVKGIERN